MNNNKIYQSLTDLTGINVYLVYTKLNKNKTITQPTTSYKLFRSKSSPQKIQHSCKNLKDLESFLYSFHEKSFIFFARMDKYTVHIDPWFINFEKCFDNYSIRNDKRSIFPASKYGDCLITSIKSELKRHSINYEKIFTYIF